MTLFKRLLAALAILFAVGTATVALQSPAMADPPCSSGYICLYSDSNGGGSQLSIPSLPGSCYSLGGGWNNIASSAVANLGYTIYLRDNWDCTGSSIRFGPAAPNYLGSFDWPYFMNDRVSAIQFWG